MSHETRSKLQEIEAALQEVQEVSTEPEVKASINIIKTELEKVIRDN